MKIQSLIQFFTSLALISLLALPLLGQRAVRVDKNVPEEIQKQLQHALSIPNSKPEIALYTCDSILQAVEGKDWPRTKGFALYGRGLSKMSQGKWKEGEDNYREALLMFRKTDDSLGVASILDNLGYALMDQGYLDKQLENQLIALDYRLKYNGHPASIARSFGAIGSVYFQLGDLEQALFNYKKSLEIRQSLKGLPPEYYGFSLRNIGKVYFKQNKMEEAARYYHMALDSMSVGDPQQFIIEVYLRLGELYTATKDFKKAASNYNLAYKTAEALNNKSNIGRTLLGKGKMYQAEGYPEKAIEGFRNAIPNLEQDHTRPELKETYEQLAEAYENKGELVQSISFFKKYKMLNDTLVNEESTRRMAEFRTRFKTENIERENQLLQDKQQYEKELRQWLLLGLGLALVAVFFIFRENKRRKKAYTELLQEKEKTEQLLKEKDALLVDLKNTQSQLIQSEKMASLGQLTAGIAHEINNPINFISSSVEGIKLDFEELRPLLHKVFQLEQGLETEKDMAEIISLIKSQNAKMLDEEIAELIYNIERGTERTKKIVQALRNFSREKSDSFAPADIHEGIETSILILNYKIKNKINIHKEYADLPLVSCEINLLNQVFINLLDNAVQALDTSGNIWIKTYLKNKQVYISIKDDGPGMDEITQKKVFDPFFSTKEVGKGTGLGMFISYGIIEQHKGKINIESKLGKGTTFLVQIPIE